MMAAAAPIPIRNLYYLLCYAWNHLRQGELIDVSRLPSTELGDLFAVVLCDGIQHLARRGLEQGYELHEEELAGVRGRIDLSVSTRRMLLVHGRSMCRFDELTVNTLQNQILKSTLRLLSRIPTLHPELRKRVRRFYVALQGVDEVVLTHQTFRRVQLHSNNRFYRFLINVCEIVRSTWLVDETTGTCRFRDFVRDEQLMARVFESFLFNFIRLEMPIWEVKRERIFWQAESATDPKLTLLPRMETDISLRRGSRHVIIDAKYYHSPFSRHYETDKLHSGNLYQLLTYLINVEVRDGEVLSGMLIYPRVDRTLRERYTIQGYNLAVCTVDLNRDWRDIRNELFEIVV